MILPINGISDFLHRCRVWPNPCTTLRNTVRLNPSRPPTRELPDPFGGGTRGLEPHVALEQSVVAFILERGKLEGTRRSLLLVTFRPPERLASRQLSLGCLRLRGRHTGLVSFSLGFYRHQPLLGFSTSPLCGRSCARSSWTVYSS